MKRFFFRIVPWIITAIALYFSVRGLEWHVLFDHVLSADPLWCLAAIVLTASSYLMRSRRWQYLFENSILKFYDAARTLILGFFMNNILPARTGEFVRAHIGAKLIKETRTLVLASIASERLLDGLMLSLFFVVAALNMGDKNLSGNLLSVAGLFAIVGGFVFITLLFRAQVFTLADKLTQKFNSKASQYTLDRLQIFVNALSPLTSPQKIPMIVFWSVVIWLVELCVYLAIANAYNTDISVAEAVFFMVTVNFSSLIPAAPGGVGVIEFFGSWALASVGVDSEMAMAMVVTQHVIQYLVVGVPGSIIAISLKREVVEAEKEIDAEE